MFGIGLFFSLLDFLKSIDFLFSQFLSGDLFLVESLKSSLLNHLCFFLCDRLPFDFLSTNFLLCNKFSLFSSLFSNNLTMLFIDQLLSVACFYLLTIYIGLDHLLYLFFLLNFYSFDFYSLLF